MRKHTPPESLETALAALEATVTSMESGQLPLDQALAAYQRGAELLGYCRQALADVEQQVRLLDDAQPLTPPNSAHD